MTIIGEMFSESLLTKTKGRWHLNRSWSIPDDVDEERYNIFATERIHKSEMYFLFLLKCNDG